MYTLPTIYTCFPGGKHKVLTFSFDDGKQEDYRLVSMFNSYGVKATFNLNSDCHTPTRIPQGEYAQVYAGHEVACHTATHPTIARCPMEQVAQQVLEDRRGLEALVGYPVRGLAYPNGSYSRPIVELLPALGIRYARTVCDTHGYAMPENFLEWHPTCHFKHDLLAHGREFTQLYKSQYLYMLYVWGHSYELPTDGGWALMEEFLKTVSGREDIWYATNIEIVDYLDGASRLIYTAAGDRVCNPNAFSCWISVNGTVLEIPAGASVTLPV